MSTITKKNRKKSNENDDHMEKCSKNEGYQQSPTKREKHLMKLFFVFNAQGEIEGKWWPQTKHHPPPCHHGHWQCKGEKE